MAKDDEGLPKFERRKVVAATVRITGAGDGLSEALQLDPEAIPYDGEVFFIVKGRVDQVNHRPLKKDQRDLLQRQHTIVVEEIFRVQQDAVDTLMKAERDRLQLAREAAQGVSRLPMGDDPLNLHGPSDEELHEAHGRGEHVGDRVPACVDCEQEAAAEAEGN